MHNLEANYHKTLEVLNTIDIKSNFLNQKRRPKLSDKDYLSSKWQLNLFEEHQIKLETPMRKNQHNFKEQPYIFRKSRKRIETLLFYRGITYF